jgi:hypothetical protein
LSLRTTHDRDSSNCYHELQNSSPKPAAWQQKTLTVRYALWCVRATDVVVEAIVIAEAQLKDIVQNLYNLIVQSYDHHGSKTDEAMKREMYGLLAE